MEIYYGISSNYINVTDICFSQLKYNNIINIPSGDGNRAKYFTDPLEGIHKKVFINNNNYLTEYDEFCSIKINTQDNTIVSLNDSNISNKLINIHSTLKINHGTLNDEIPEQKMVVRYLTGCEKVLEIGGNIGRNTLVIASILENDKNLVTLESCQNISRQLIENRDLNNFNFYVENSALSKRKLIQYYWETIPSDILLDKYKWVNTITLEELQDKYNIDFDTLVLDCEGAFYYILMDMPEILENITLIIMENDYTNINHKIYIDKVLKENNFHREYVEGNGWGPCTDYFFEVWKKE
jgi:FkbM family methyltransferase